MTLVGKGKVEWRVREGLSKVRETLKHAALHNFIMRARSGVLAAPPLCLGGLQPGSAALSGMSDSVTNGHSFSK